MAIRTCIFDAYGTLFDVAAAARMAADRPGGEVLKDSWPTVAAEWRRKQLEYTWLRAAADRHTDFWQVTQDALDWVLEAQKLTDPDLREQLLGLYRQLSVYPEVPEMLKVLRARGMTLGILSNGTPKMLTDACGAAGIGDAFDALLSVEDVGVFKPDARVYDMVGARFGTDPSEVLFMSSNGWDAAGAAGYGFNTAWVNRAGDPVDRLYARPSHVIADLTAVPELV